jgi:hypothetical protein
MSTSVRSYPFLYSAPKGPGNVTQFGSDASRRSFTISSSETSLTRNTSTSTCAKKPHSLRFEIPKPQMNLSDMNGKTCDRNPRSRSYSTASFSNSSSSYSSSTTLHSQSTMRTSAFVKNHLKLPAFDPAVLAVGDIINPTSGPIVTDSIRAYQTPPKQELLTLICKNLNGSLLISSITSKSDPELIFLGYDGHEAIIHFLDRLYHINLPFGITALSGNKESRQIVVTFPNGFKMSYYPSLFLNLSQ